MLGVVKTFHKTIHIEDTIKYARSSSTRSCTTALRQRMDVLAKELDVNHIEDWYKLSSKDYETKLGYLFTSNFNCSPLQLLSSTFPEHEWLPWKFKKTPSNYWTDMNNQRKFLEWVGKQLNIKEMSDWYKLSNEELIELGGKYLLNIHNSSLHLLMMSVFPEYEWLPWKWSTSPKNYWRNVKNQKLFVDWAGKKLGVKEMSDWYSIRKEDFFELGGVTLVNLYSSFPQMLFTVYPEYDWLPWKFSRASKKYWDNVKNQRKFLDWAGKELGIKEMSDWYNIKSQDIRELGGYRLFMIYNLSVYNIFSSVYPEHNWISWKFKSSANIQFEEYKSFMETIAKELNIKEMKDWYNVTTEKLIEMGGGILLVQYHTLFELLSTIYSDFKWEKQSFSSQNKDIWNDEHLANYFVQWLQKQPKNEVANVFKVIKTTELKASSPLTQLLQKTFPQYKWTNVVHKSKKSQYMLKECVEKLFVSEKNRDIVLLEEYKHPDIANLELDLYIPQHNIAFEYQGMQHYRAISVFNRLDPMENLKNRDKQKSKVCKELGITLIEVPYWWDRKINSLAATIYNERPDLFESKPRSLAIRKTPPLQYNSQAQSRPDSLMTATEWDNETMEPKGWFMTEKYDGMRLHWNGTQFFTRQGKKLNVPESITKQMPSVSLDGELWTQYGLYQDAVNLSKSNDEAKWSKATYWIFDSPNETMALEERVELLQNLFLPSFAKVVEFVKCESKEHLKQFNDSIIAKGGEGVMLREPQSMYKQGRSTSLRRLKQFHDTEVTVVQNQYPHGFLCEQSNGKTIFVNMPIDALESAKQIEVGSVITVKHSGTNKHGTLMYPKFYRQRTDVDL